MNSPGPSQQNWHSDSIVCIPLSPPICEIIGDIMPGFYYIVKYFQLVIYFLIVFYLLNEAPRSKLRGILIVKQFQLQ